MSERRRLAVPAVALALAQITHGAVPSPETNEGGYVGLVGGLVLLIMSVVVAAAALKEKSWARPLAIVNGVGVAGGFVLYHALPWRSPVTNPYFGTDGIGAAQWIPVLFCIVAGVLLVFTAREISPDRKAALA